MDRAALDTIGLSDFRTPLGEPMDEISALILNEDPIGWHFQYWLSLSVLGVLRGEDPILMAFRIEIELYNVLDRQYRNAFHQAWNEYLTANHEPCLEYWELVSVEDEKVQQYFRDLDQMLVNKEQKAKDNLRGMEELMIIFLRDARLEQARETFEILSLVYPKLHEEEIADAKAKSRKSKDTNSLHRKRSYEEISGEDDLK